MKREYLLIYLGLLIPLALYCFIWRILKMNNGFDTEIMGDLIAAAAVIVAALLGLVTAVIIDIFQLRSINKHLGFNSQDESLKETFRRSLGTNEKSLTTQLGVGSNDKSISEQLGIGAKSISEQLGVGVDDKSLTKQHEDLKLCISERNSDIASMASIIRNNEERRNNLNTTQQGLLDTLNAFMSDWQSLQSKIAYLETELAQRDDIIRALRSENEELKTAISELEEQDQNSPEE